MKHIYTATSACEELGISFRTLSRTLVAMGTMVGTYGNSRIVRGNKLSRCIVIGAPEMEKIKKFRETYTNKK